MRRALAAEALGTALLLAAVVGSGVMAERLAGGNVAIALLANTMATATALVVLILAFGPVSGAHLNPCVTLVAALRGLLPPRLALAYVVVQLAGAVAGVVLAHAMFELPLLAPSQRMRAGFGQGLSEGVATFGLIATVVLVARDRPGAVAAAVAAWIASAYWFTASTSFANPAVTVARALTDTFAGVQPADVPPFLVAQVAGALLAYGVCRWLAPDPGPAPDDAT